jgi:hypothetical protein
MNNILFNPFRYIAGFKSLMLGIFILLTTAVVGFFSHTHFPDLISVKNGADFPLIYYVIQSLVNWLVISFILYLFAIFSSTSTIRIIDIFGTQALARAPYLIASIIGFSGALEKFGKYILWTTLKTGESTTISSGEVTVALFLIILSLLLSIWLVALMYNAFKVSANLKGTKSALLFIISFVLSMGITIFLNRILILKFFMP